MALFKPGDLVTRRPEWDYTPNDVVWSGVYLVEDVKIVGSSCSLRLKGRFGWYIAGRFLLAHTLSMKDFL